MALMKKLKNKCCKKYRKKAKVCSSCPLRACLGKKERRELIGRFQSSKKKKAA